jgi:monovalent cation/hydrogen antiporter
MIFSQLLIVVIAAIAITIFAERRNIQAPLLIALLGLAASFIPGVPRLELEPEVILTIVLPPLLFSAASEFSFVSFVRRLGSIVNLGVFLVAVTTGFVGAIAAAAVPHMTLPVALVLAAVISPPDAVTAVAIGRKLGLPSRLMTVLKGESLINDAAALTFFSFTAAAVAGTHIFIGNMPLYFLYSAVVGIITGVTLGAVVHRIRLRVTNPSLATVLTVLVPFTAYLLAQEFQASGVLAVVAAGFSLGHNAPEASYAARIQERQFWKTLDALLEAFVFAYIGLQLRFVIEDAVAAGFDLWSLLGTAGVVLLAVIAIRIPWVFVTAALGRWRHGRILTWLTRQRDNPRRQAARFAARANENPRRAERRKRIERGRARVPPEPFSWKENLIISWTGMRGVVTLAAAAGIPLVTASGEAFPGRDVIQAIAFVVTIGTLLIQGLTLPWLIEWLRVSNAGDAEREAAQRKLAEYVGRKASLEAVTAFRDRQTTDAGRQMAESLMQRVKENRIRVSRHPPATEAKSSSRSARRC